MDSAANAQPFPFFKLPAEIRNKIYRLVVVTGQNLAIGSMHLDKFEKSQDNGTYQSRSTFIATDHQCDFGCRPINSLHGLIPSCSFTNWRLAPAKTTYTLGTPILRDTTTTNMLSLNKESREEVAYIFYGENCFHFTTMSPLIPFLKDRTPETRKYIQRLKITLNVDDRDWDTIFTEYSRPTRWNTTLSMLMKLPHMNVKRLFVEIDDMKANLFKDGMNLRSKSMLWLHKLSNLENLDLLGLNYHVAEWKRSLRYRRPIIYGRLIPIQDEEVNTQTEQELWRFLAPKMLKKEADDHSLDALQKRRIWEEPDELTHDDTYTGLDLLGNFDINSDSD